MRLSTISFYTGSIAAMQTQSAELAKLQNQVALGRRVMTPADDPIAAVHIIDLERAQRESEQYGKNSTLARNRLNLEEQSLADAGLILTRVRELTVQAGNIGTLTAADRQSIATELASLRDQLQQIGNRQDASGEYIFSGYSTQTKPFTGGANSAIAYEGDQGSRLLQVSTTQRVADGHSGYDVFMNIPEGNGVFAAAAATTNTGTGVIGATAVANRTTWAAAAGDYTITFTSPTTWEVSDGATPPNPVANGTYATGQPIAFNGITVEITGAPAAGDTFTVRPSQQEDMFTTMDKLIGALRGATDDPVSSAQLATSIGASLQQLDRASDHLLSIRAEVGARLSSLDNADSTRAALDVDLASSLSDLRDLDYAEALTKMNQRLIGLQAAQMSYSRISQLSLFNYLR